MVTRKRVSARSWIEANQNEYDATGLRELPSIPFGERRVPPRFQSFATDVLLPQITFTGCKLDEKRRVAVHCLHNATLAGAAAMVVGDTRDTHKPGVRLRVVVWDAIRAAGLVEMQRGSEASGMQTRYRSSEKLLAHFPTWPLQDLLNVELERNTTMPDQTTWEALVVLQAGRNEGGEVLPMPAEDLGETFGTPVTAQAYLEAVEDDIEFINRTNTGHAWQAYKELPDGRHRNFQPNIVLKQLHSKKLFRYARLDTWDAASAQNLPKRERQLIRIDGEPVTEFDYAGLHIRMLHHLNGHDPPHDEDVYRPGAVLPRAWADADDRRLARSYVKRATNILLNTTSRRQAAGAINNLLRDDGNGPAWAAMLRCERVKASDILRRIIKSHPEVAHRFLTDVGAELQTLDEIVMRRVLKAFAIEDRPAQGIHDSVLCRVSDAGFAEAMMRIHYHWMLGFYPVVTKVS